MHYLSGDCENFQEVLLKDMLRDAIGHINRHKDEPWLDEARTEKALHDLERVATPSLIEANEEATQLLQKAPA